MTREDTGREVLVSPYAEDDDEGRRPGPGRGLRGHRRLVALGVAFVLGAAAGAGAMARWDERAAEDERRSAVDVQVDSPFTFRFASAPWESQRLDLTVHNGGPLPVTVEGLDPRRPGVRVLAGESSFPVTVRPGQTGLVSLSLEVTRCGNGGGPAVDQAGMTVTTADGATRRVDVFFAQPGHRLAEAHGLHCAGEVGAPPAYPQGSPTPVDDAGG